MHEFLACLVKVEDQLTRPTVDVVNPLQATSGSALENGFKVVNKLGAGATAVAFLVERQGESCVLKVARSADFNSRIKREFELLKQLNWPQIVTAADLCEFGELYGFTMESAGDLTLARHLRSEGALDLTMRGVEMWRGEFGELPFPHPALQTGRAVFPHRASGQGAQVFAHGRFAVCFFSVDTISP